eukprot:349704-Chlamydomonas_euryale.AAC.1
MCIVSSGFCEAGTVQVVCGTAAGRLELLSSVNMNKDAMVNLSIAIACDLSQTLHQLSQVPHGFAGTALMQGCTE